MIEISVEVEGDQALLVKFGAMTEDLRTRLRTLFPQVGEEIRAAAAGAAPRSPRRSSASKKYGPLHNKIVARLYEKGDQFVETVSLGSAFYGSFQEHGLDTTRRPPRSRGIVGVRLRHLKSGGVAASPRRGLGRRQDGAGTPMHIPAHPFMGPAFASRRDTILGRIRAATAQAVQ